MIPAVYMVARSGYRPAVEVAWRAAMFAAAWAAVYGALLWWYGHREYYCDVVMLATNFSSWFPSVRVVLLFGVM